MKKKSGSIRNKLNTRIHTRPCLMAYTLNNVQPVICTIVADQPYFYMDEEASTGVEDDLLGLETLDNFEREIEDIKTKIEAIEKISREFDQSPDRRLELFIADGLNICEENDIGVAQPILWEKVEQILSQSRMAKELLDYAYSKAINIEMSTQEKDARYDSDNGKIVLGTGLGFEEVILLSVRELRRHWQHRQGALIHPLSFHPDHAILINRAQSADLSVAMIRAAWELQLAGTKDIWAYIENSHFADLGRALAKEAFVDFRSLNTGKASMAVFESWFLSDRSRYMDKKLIQQMLADHNGYVFNNIESSKAVTMDLISALGAQPFGKNYLSDFARILIEDPVFTEVRDRSNANFLWFVKFERTFRETEQVLQSDGNLPGADILFSSSSLQSDQSHDKTATLVEFLPFHSSRGQKSDGFEGGTVIHVQFGGSTRAS